MESRAKFVIGCQQQTKRDENDLRDVKHALTLYKIFHPLSHFWHHVINTYDARQTTDEWSGNFIARPPRLTSQNNNQTRDPNQVNTNDQTINRYDTKSQSSYQQGNRCHSLNQQATLKLWWEGKYWFFKIWQVTQITRRQNILRAGLYLRGKFYQPPAKVRIKFTE